MPTWAAEMPSSTAIATSRRRAERSGDPHLFSIRAKRANEPASPPGGGPVTTAVRAKLGSRTALASAWSDAPGCRLSSPFFTRPVLGFLHSKRNWQKLSTGVEAGNPEGTGEGTGGVKAQELGAEVTRRRTQRWQLSRLQKLPRRTITFTLSSLSGAKNLLFGARFRCPPAPLKPGP